jgi:hypothetical protein
MAIFSWGLPVVLMMLIALVEILRNNSLREGGQVIEPRGLVLLVIVFLLSVREGGLVLC